MAFREKILCFSEKTAALDVGCSGQKIIGSFLCRTNHGIQREGVTLAADSAPAPIVSQSLEGSRTTTGNSRVHTIPLRREDRQLYHQAASYGCEALSACAHA